MESIAFTPRSDFVRTIPVSANFQLFGPERRVSLVAADHGILLDAFLSINTGSSVLLKAGPNEFVFPEDIRVGISHFKDGAQLQIDLTPEVLVLLREALDASDQAGLKKAYQVGMEYWLSTLIPSWGYSEVQITAARQVVAKLLTVDRISTYLQQFGGPRTGETLSGSLYISNYLYTFIPVPAISLGQILSQKSISLQNLQAPYFWVSHLAGKKDTTVGGQADIMIQAIYHNELIDEFDDLEHKIKVRLVEIHEKLAPDGPIVQGILDTKDNIMRLTRQLNDFQAALKIRNFKSNPC